MRANYHTHSLFCDGKASPADMAKAARAAGYDILGFSSHAPLGPDDHWTMRTERLEEYRDEVRRLGAAWAPGGEEAREAGPLEILLGLEVDWLPGTRQPGDGAFSGLGLDYILGSVHYAEAAPGHLFTVDCSESRFELSLLDSGRDGGSARSLYIDYYRRLGELADAGGFDILGHFDLVRKNNGGSRWFDETETAYLDAAFDAASRLRGRGIVVEINVGGMARGKTKEPYPSLPILSELRRLEVPITFCADAHAPEHLGVHLDAARDLARRAGYRSILVLSGGKWIEAGIEST